MGSQQIINLDRAEFVENPFPGPKERYGARIALLSPRLGAKLLGYNLTVIEPGKAAFPRHNHWTNEELFLVLEGEGEVRIGDERYPLRKGDVLACPPGGTETAHQIINTSDVEMKLFAVSTQISAEMVEFPDSGKFGVIAMGPTGSDRKQRHFRFVSRPDQSLDYWDGE